MSSHTPKSKKLSLDELVFGALSQLQVLQYDQRSIRRYQTVWRKLVIFARQQGYKGKLREQLILDFLDTMKSILNCQPSRMKAGKNMPSMA